MKGRRLFGILAGAMCLLLFAGSAIAQELVSIEIKSGQTYNLMTLGECEK
ncbi:hypothetical protein KAW65_06280 [candidate division WOR-3 bacterium]|nr:hypothetical protein [candidate division WOR-3 bacterium]